MESLKRCRYPVDKNTVDIIVSFIALELQGLLGDTRASVCHSERVVCRRTIEVPTTTFSVIILSYVLATRFCRRILVSLIAGDPGEH